MKRSEITFAAFLPLLDFLALLAAFLLAYHIRSGFAYIFPQDLSLIADRLRYAPADLGLTFSHYLRYISVIIPGMLVIFGFAGLYAIRSDASWTRRFFQIVIGVSVGEFFILLLFLLKKDFFLPRSVVLYSWVLAVLFVFGLRLIYRLVQQQLHARGIGVIRIGVIGKSKVAERIISQLSARAFSPYRLAAHFDSQAARSVIEQIKAETLDEVIVVSEHYSNDELIVLRNHCLEHHIAFSFVPPLLTGMQSSFDVRSVGNLPVIEVRPTPLEGWGRILKRAFDVVAALLLIVLFSPVYLAIALGIKITSPGPLIYKHTRFGKNRQPIRVWKFRSMKYEFCTGVGGEGDALFAKLLKDNPAMAKEWEETQKLKNDPRISKIGTFLRKSSLDELPQFFNVLGGSLSLVGPRPIVDEEIRKYGETARILFTVKPGVTGLWQVSGRNDVSYEERTALDTQYIEHWNLWWDILIMLKTGGVILSKVFSPKKNVGAY